MAGVRYDLKIVGYAKKLGIGGFDGVEYLGGAPGATETLSEVDTLGLAGWVAATASWKDEAAIVKDACQIRGKLVAMVTEEGCVARLNEYNGALVAYDSACEFVQHLWDAVNAEDADKAAMICRGVIEALRRTGTKLKSIGQTIWKRAIEVVDAIKNCVGSVAKKAADLLRQLSDVLTDLSSFIVDRFLAFASTIAEVANTRGFALSEVSAKWPSPSCSIGHVLGVPLFIPRIGLPEVTYKFAPRPSTPPST